MFSSFVYILTHDAPPSLHQQGSLLLSVNAVCHPLCASSHQASAAKTSFSPPQSPFTHREEDVEADEEAPETGEDPRHAAG